MRQFPLLVSVSLIIGTTGCTTAEWRITGFVTECPANDFAFANADEREDYAIEDRAVSERLPLKLGNRISTRIAMAVKFEKEFSFLNVLGAGCNTASTAVGDPDDDQDGPFFHLDAGWVYLRGPSPGGGTKMVRAHAVSAEADYLIRVIPGPPEQNQIFLRPGSSITVACNTGTASKSLQCPSTECPSSPQPSGFCPCFLEVTMSGNDCTFVVNPLNAGSDEEDFLTCANARIKPVLVAAQ